MKNFSLFLLLSCTILFSQCQQADDNEPAPFDNAALDCNEQLDACEVNAASTAFGLNIFRELHKEDPDNNIFISPLSISTALSMTVNGAAGDTRSAMMQVLEQQNIDLNAVNQGYQQLLALLPQLDESVILQLANSIWYKQGFQVRQPFLDTNETYYSSEVAALDFSDPSSVDVINGWVSDQTNGLIDNVLNSIPSDVVMYLINAIYFKGAWLHEFDPEETIPYPFQLQDGSTTEIEMMGLGQRVLPYLETEHFQAVDLAYGDSIFTMSLILPKPDVSMDAVVEELKAENWQSWAQSFSNREILFGMPKFTLEYKESLRKVLTTMGMGIAFGDGNTDFSNIAQADLLIDDVIHQSFLEVNEAGTEAAAVTVVVIVETSVPLLPTVVLDRPFLFVIRENQGNGILFIGKLMNPNA
ncbi:MAG TPA: serpin family protein [Saprospiraceae bacterium]|nr:serpin family protein [Saprospiraceae bacterium]HMQ83785.1 serpin family protein [Saprospiraceae bacterium]